MLATNWSRVEEMLRDVYCLGDLWFKNDQFLFQIQVKDEQCLLSYIVYWIFKIKIIDN